MQQLYRCDYCDKIGSEEEIYYHEGICEKNANKKSCKYCEHMKIAGSTSYKCTHPQPFTLPDGKMMVNCPKFSPEKEVQNISDLFSKFF